MKIKNISLLMIVLLLVSTLFAVPQPTEAATVIVSAGTPNGWAWGADVGVAGATGFVEGPGTPPMGTGSAQITLADNTSGFMFYENTGRYNGLLLSSITALSYSTYRVAGPSDTAIAIQFNVDYDATDSTTTWQSRLTFEGRYTHAIPSNTWQTWDTLTQGRWWGPGTPIVGDVPVASSCYLGSPCTWAEVLAAYPNISVHPVQGAMLLKAGSGWAGGFEGYVDGVHIATSTGIDDTWDFEASQPLAAAFTCNLGVAGIDITSGDANFTIDYVLNGVAQAQLGPVGLGSHILNSDAVDPNSYTNIVVSELGGNTQTLNLADVDCGSGTVISPGSGVGVPNLGEILITTSGIKQPYDSAGGEPIYHASGAPLFLPHDYDSNGFDTYIVTAIQFVGEEKWLGFFLGDQVWAWLPADEVTVIR